MIIEHLHGNENFNIYIQRITLNGPFKILSEYVIVYDDKFTSVQLQCVVKKINFNQKNNRAGYYEFDIQ